MATKKTEKMDEDLKTGYGDVIVVGKRLKTGRPVFKVKGDDVETFGRVFYVDLPTNYNMNNLPVAGDVVEFTYTGISNTTLLPEGAILIGIKQ